MSTEAEPTGTAATDLLRQLLAARAAMDALSTESTPAPPPDVFNAVSVQRTR